MNQALLRILLGLLLVVTITGCTEEEPAPVAKVDNDHLLTDHAWKTDRIEIISGDSLTAEDKERLRQKHTHETLLFKKDGKFIIENNYGYSIKYGGWYLSDDYTFLKLNTGYSWIVVELSEKALTLRVADSLFEPSGDWGNGGVITVYFVHKN
jgi:hypothetical protein